MLVLVVGFVLLLSIVVMFDVSVLLICCGLMK